MIPLVKIIPMCTPSENFKLCTCSNLKGKDLDGNWTISRWRSKGSIYIGQSMTPQFLSKIWSFSQGNKDDKNFGEWRKKNMKLKLLEALNTQEDIFDFPYTPERWDLLRVHLVIDKEEDLHGEYYFEFEDEKWVSIDEGDTMNHDVLRNGKLKVEDNSGDQW